MKGVSSSGFKPYFCCLLRIETVVTATGLGFTIEWLKNGVSSKKRINRKSSGRNSVGPGNINATAVCYKIITGLTFAPFQ